MAHSLKTKNELSEEILTLQQRIVELEAQVRKKIQTEKVFQDPMEVTRIMLEYATDAIYVIQDGFLKFVNSKVTEISGYSREELMTKPRMEFVHPDDRPMIYERALKRMRGERVPNLYPHRTLDKWGNIKWIEVNSVMITWEGRPAQLCFQKDITARKAAEEELKAQTENLTEMNAALKVLLKHRENDRKEIEERLSLNIKELVLPYVEKLKTAKLDATHTAYIHIIDDHLREILSPFLIKLTSKHSHFTPREIQVAGFIKDGMTTKDIANILNVSTNSVDVYRQNIRKKLGISNKKVNLRSLFISLE